MEGKKKEKVTRNPAIGVAGEQPSYMYNSTIITDTMEAGNLQATNETTLFERMGGKYEEINGIFYPLISTEEDNVDVGKYGLIWMDYMQNAYPERYISLKRFCKLREKAAEVNKEAYWLLDEIMDKQLKGKVMYSNSTMKMWKFREQAKVMAEEIVIVEVVMQFH